MSINSKKEQKRKGPLQFRIPTDNQAGADLAEKLKKISDRSGLSLNDICNLTVAAGLPMVERKLSELAEPEAA